MLIERFIRYLQFEKRFSPHTIRGYKTDLEQFNFSLNTELQISEVDHKRVRVWIVELMEEDMNPSSINRKLSTLRSFYKFLLREGVISVNPMSLIKAPKIPKRLPAIIEESKLDQLLDNSSYFGDGFIGIRDRLVVELLYGTGIRLSELIGLNDQDISFFEQNIKVLGKRNKERLVPLHQPLLKLTREYLDLKLNQNFRNNTDALIVSNTGSKSYPNLINRIVKLSLSKISTQSKRSPHILRHSFATAMLNKGADLNAIKELLGHSSLAATQVYTHNSFEKLKSVYKLAHPKA